MVYIDIPYAAENNRISKELARSEIEKLQISDKAKKGALTAIYNFRPRGVDFTGNEAIEAILLEVVLKNLGVPYRRIDDPEHYLSEGNNA